MQKMIKTGAFVSLFAITVLWSCSEDDPQKAELSAEVKQFLAMRMGSANGLSTNAMGPVNGSFINLNSFAGRIGGRIAGDSTNVPGDSTSNPEDSTIWENPWQTCATYTTIENPDGSTTWIVDYGDGCWEGWDPWKYFMHGKVSSTYKYMNDSSGSVFTNLYFYKSEYDNYGGYYTFDSTSYEWLINGFYNYEGESSYNLETQKYSGWYSHSSNSEYLSDSILYTYIGEGYSHYDQDKLVVESNNYQYTTGSDYYKTKVLTPLVSDYTCYRNYDGVQPFCIFWVYVSGREEIQYKWGDNEGSFIIDYGDGTCDNIITIIENGVSVELDLSKNWYF